MDTNPSAWICTYCKTIYTIDESRGRDRGRQEPESDYCEVCGAYWSPVIHHDCNNMIGCVGVYGDFSRTEYDGAYPNWDAIVEEEKVEIMPRIEIIEK